MADRRKEGRSLISAARRMTPRGLGEISGTAPGRAAAVWGRVSQPGFGSDKTAAATNAANSEGTPSRSPPPPGASPSPPSPHRQDASQGIPERERARAGQRCGPATTPRPARPAHSTGGVPAGHVAIWLYRRGWEGGEQLRGRVRRPFPVLPTPRCAPANRRQRVPHEDAALSIPTAPPPYRPADDATRREKTDQAKPAEPEKFEGIGAKPPENRAALAGGPVRAPSPTDRTPLLPRYGSDVVQRAEPARTGGRTDRAGGEAGGYASHGRFLPTPDCVPRQRPTTGSAQGRRVVNPDDASFLPDPQTAQPGEKKPDQAKPAEPENFERSGIKPSENRAAVAGGRRMGSGFSRPDPVATPHAE